MTDKGRKATTMEMNITERDNVTVVALSGNLDASTSPDFETCIKGLESAGKVNIVLDMGAVRYVSSAGLRVLQIGMRATREKGGDLRLASLTPSVREVFEITGFVSAFTITKSVDEAASSFTPMVESEVEDIQVLEISGDLDAAAAPSVSGLLMGKVSSGKPQIVLDLKKVAYIASVGFRALQSAWMAARSRGGDVRFANVQPNVENVFASLGFLPMFMVYPDITAAVTSFDSDSGDSQGREGK